jgi:hypothetical protein
MILRRPEQGRSCGECSAPLHADQRYCLRCGARAGAPRVDPLGSLGFGAEGPELGAGALGAATVAAAPLPQDPSDGQVAPPAESANAPGSRTPANWVPSRRLAAALAVATLAIGGVAGAAVGPSPAPSVAAAPQRLVALVVPGAAPSATTEAPVAEEPPAVEEVPETPSADDGPAASDATTDSADTTADDSDAADDTTAGDTDAGDDEAPAAADAPASSTSPETTTSTAGTAPAHLFVVSLTQLDATAFAPASPLADLVAQGTVLSNYTAAAPSAAANQVALFGGQVPTADCTTALASCVLPAGETSLPDQVSTLNLTWRAYVEDAALRCPATPAPSPRLATSLFTTLTTRADCATTTVGLEQLATDLQTTDKTPALSLVVPSATTLDTLSAPLHALVAQITASPAYQADGVLVLVSDSAPAGSTAPLGALVLSPRATPARTVDTATGPVALLRSLDELLDLTPLATAADAPAGALDGVLASTATPASTTSPASTTTPTATTSIFPHPHPTITTRRSP